jgi:hypothetical protein
MADEPDNIVLRFLRQIDQKVDTLAADVKDLKIRAGRIESGLAQVHVHLAEHSVRMDRIEDRLDRIEKRLSLVDVVP